MGRYIFEGVLGIDYTFSDIGEFLKEGYFDSSTMVVVYEEQEPNYIVASSTGRKAATKVLTEDESQPCPDSGSSDTGICVVVRESMALSLKVWLGSEKTGGSGVGGMQFTVPVSTTAVNGDSGSLLVMSRNAK